MEQILPSGRPSRTRILFVVTKSVLGGAQRYVYDLATSLPRDTYDVAVAFGGTGAPKSAPGILSDMLVGAGVRTIYIPELGRDLNASSDKAAYQALRTLFEKERPDIVHLNSSKVGGLGALAARRAHVRKIIYTAHGWAFTERVSPFARLIRLLLSYATILLSDTVICVSKSDRRAAAWLPFTHGKLRVIHNGIRSMPSLTREEARATLFSPQEIARHANDLWIVSVAELTQNKNLFRSADAIAIANSDTAAIPIFYTIIGMGEQHKALQAYIEKKNLAGSVHLAGFVPESRRYLAGFDGVLFASIKEGLPYAILEAGLAELPIVASRTGGIPEIITHSETGLLIEDPRSPHEIATTLSRLRDSATRKRLQSGLRKQIESEFSFEEMRNQTFGLYQEK
jgi:glycosyltransferase involved in cell wall biosynthesis